MNKDKVKRLPDQVSLRSTRPAMTNTVGRSMVEMLGVLAIIGVLSAGALAGYSKAMFRHKVNQTIDIFSKALQRVEELEQMDLGGDFAINSNDDYIKYGIFPECQKVGNYGCQLPVGMVSLYNDPFIVDGILYGSISVYFNSTKECAAFVSAHWEKVIPPEWFEPTGGVEVPEYRIGYGEEWTTAELVDACETGCEGNEYDCVVRIIVREQ